MTEKPMTEHERLFAAYEQDLRAAKELAENWWYGLLARESTRTGDAAMAEAAVRERWPLGPVSHPRVIAVFRKYYLACEALNDEIEQRAEQSDAGSEEQEFADDGAWGTSEGEPPTAGTVEPRTFAYEWPRGELHQFVIGLVFVPIGMKYGEYV